MEKGQSVTGEQRAAEEECPTRQTVRNSKTGDLLLGAVELGKDY